MWGGRLVCIGVLNDVKGGVDRCVLVVWVGVPWMDDVDRWLG